MKVRGYERLYPEGIVKYKEQLLQWTVVEEATNWLTTWIAYAIFGRVMVTYTKLPTIIQYKVGSVKDKLSEEEYLALTSVRVSTVLLSVSLARSRTSATYFNWERR